MPAGVRCASRSCPEGRTSDSLRPTGLVNVPPMSNHRDSYGHVVALDAFNLRQVLLRKEVIQPHLPVRLPCYDLVPIANPTFDGSLQKGWATGFGCYRLS